MRGETVAALIIAGCLVAVIAIAARPSVTVTQTPAHSVAAVTPAPTPTAPPDPFAPARWAAANVAVIALVLAIGVGVPVGIALHAWHRGRLLELDHPPLRRPEFVHRAFDVKALEARRGWLPESFTYSPHMRNDAAVIEEEEPMAMPGPALTAQEALDMPGIVYGQRLDTGEPLIEQRVLSLAIGGRPGSGKTSTALLLAGQYARMGADLRVADPHSGHPGSLLTQLEPVVGPSALGWVAETPRETLMLVGQVADQLEQRKAGWRHHNGDQRPLVLLIDEFAESLRLLPPGDRERLLDLVQLLGYGGRKYGVCCVLLAQSWLTGSIGSSGVRNPLRAAIVHAMRADEGRALTGMRAEAWPSDPQELRPGEAYVLGVGASGLVRVRVPLLESPTRAPVREASASNSDVASTWLPGGFRPGFQPPARGSQ
jgi:hypothetical protein